MTCALHTVCCIVIQKPGHANPSVEISCAGLNNNIFDFNSVLWVYSGLVGIGQDWQSVGPCRVYALAPIRPIDLGIRILQVRSGISKAGFMLGSVRNRQSME